MKKIPERLMEHMAKNIFREAAEKEGLTGKEAEGAVKEKAGIIPEAAYGDKAHCRPDILEILKRLGAAAYIPIRRKGDGISELYS